MLRLSLSCGDAPGGLTLYWPHHCRTTALCYISQM